MNQNNKNQELPLDKNSANRSAAEAISLPKGGGAISGISEQFSANPVTGTASFSIPLPISPARGFQPELSLSYDSGAGNSAFGLGWDINTPSIVRKTAKGLPTYQDNSDSDTYTLSGTEDLVPFLADESGDWTEVITSLQLEGKEWEVKRYRPRIESAYAKIERWRDTASNIIWWRTVSPSNVSTVFGFHEDACIFEPGKREKTYRWMIDFSYDDKGHVTLYQYKRENAYGIPFHKAHEKHRQGAAFSQLYLKKILYGIKSSRLKSQLSDEALFTHRFDERDFHFQTVLDYGDHSELSDGSISSTADIHDWPSRPDAFSNYRAGFEIRSYRRCHRVMLFHDFPELSDQPELIKSLQFDYDEAIDGFSFLSQIQQHGYKREASQLVSAAMPAMRYDYQAHAWDNQIHDIDQESRCNLPAGVDGQHYQWVDLYGEGLNGVLTEQTGALHYKQNNGGGHFSQATVISPAPTSFNDTWHIQDLESNGIKSLVTSNDKHRAYYSFGDASINKKEWQTFSPFKHSPNIRFDDPNLRLIDLNGNGKADLLITDEQVMRWHPSLGVDGFDEAQFSNQIGEENKPDIIFSNESESIFIADMSGDGLNDIVRIRNGSVVYWPNTGYGRFGKKICMSHAPLFNHPDLFTAKHIRLADLDGSGTSDIIYLGKNEFQYWLNNSGNCWSEARKTLNPFPNIDTLTNISVIDLLGTGTACVVWSSTAPSVGNTIRYIDLMAGQKPHLMRSYRNGFGKTINLEYTPSTQFYLEDKAKGEPWISKLHFPVHCLSSVETLDNITGARFINHYSYHHGYYDHTEREFRGFGRVDQTDTETYEHFVKTSSSNIQEQVLHQTPTLTKTWFHNGAYLDQQSILNQYASEYCDYENPDYAHLERFTLPQPSLPEDLSTAEWREALRACKGMALRSETYGLDGTDKQNKPFSITYNNCAIKRVQAKADNPYAVFQVIKTETLSLTLDRKPADPRISHNLLLKSNDYGQPILSALVHYGRNPTQQNSALPTEVEEAQLLAHCVISEVKYTDDDYGLLGQHQANQFNSVLRSPTTWRTNRYQFGINDWQWSEGVYTAEALLNQFTSVETEHVDYLRKINGKDFADVHAGEVRLLSASQQSFANTTLDAPLPNGKQNPLGISWTQHQLAFTPALIEHLYGDRIDQDHIEGGYLDINQDGNWWASSGHAIYQHPDHTDDVSNRFYLPYGTRDAFGAASWAQLDDYLLLTESRSVSRIGYDTSNTRLATLNESIAVNDYRTLNPKYMRDANDNWSAVEIDALGFVIKSAIMGKVIGAKRDNPPADNAVTEGDNLDNPSAEMQYGFYDESKHQPAWVKSKTYTQHYAQQQIPRNELNSRLDFIEQYEYSDGAGNIVMTKAQTTPGIAKQMQADGSIVEVDTKTLATPDRWIGNGRTIINNKGKAVKQYEPYFSVTHEYESAAALVETGITPILFYDAAGRKICKLNPNKTYDKVVFDAWQQQNWDVNDTLYLPQDDGSKLSDITQDPDVGHFFTELDSTEISPSWYAANINSANAQQQKAAQQTELHVATPSIHYSDALGRTIYALAQNRRLDKNNNIVDEQYASSSAFDIEGNSLSVSDARNNQVMQFRYNMLPPPDKESAKPALYQNSMDGGEKWSLFDAQGKALYHWDSREHVFENHYDSLHRPSHTLLIENGQHKKINISEYIDSDHINANTYKQNNLIGSAITTYDQAGRNQLIKVDFKGNSIESTRTLTSNYKTTVDWDADPENLLEDETFISMNKYDALNRITYATSPHHTDIEASITKPTYNEAGALHHMLAAIRSNREEDLTAYVKHIEHDAKGQRQHIEYGNGVITRYEYETDTYRLSKLLTQDASGNTLQDLTYLYDPAGNIIDIRDNAQSTTFFNNATVEAHRHYTYDALYRLSSATGREHATQAHIPVPQNGWVGLQTSDDLALQHYIQSYEYDSVGNITQMAHRRPNNNNTGWTRHYEYEKNNNRLKATTLGDPDLPFTEQYQYNAHGSMTSMPHLPSMDWNYSEQLRHVNLQGGGDAYYVYSANGQRTRKIIETNGSTIKDRIYLGGWEIYRERNASRLTLQRESLHIMDDQQRIALVETKTVGSNDIESSLPITRYQLGNHLGSVNLELDNTGDIISYEEFHPYGTTAYHAGSNLISTSQKRYRYTGKERDEETGFSYHSARYLCCWLGRWCSADPIGIGDGKNLYRYVSNRILNRVDRNGKQEAPPPMSQELKDAWKRAEDDRFSDESVDALIRQYESERAANNQDWITSTSALEYATVRGNAAVINWEDGNYLDALGHGGLAIIESFGYTTLGEDHGDTAKKVAVEVVTAGVTKKVGDALAPVRDSSVSLSVGKVNNRGGDVGLADKAIGHNAVGTRVGDGPTEWTDLVVNREGQAIVRELGDGIRPTTDRSKIVEIPVTDAQARMAQRQAASKVGENGDYALLQNDCAVHGCDVLGAAGIPTAPYGSPATHFITTPLLNSFATPMTRTNSLGTLLATGELYEGFELLPTSENQQESIPNSSTQDTSIEDELLDYCTVFTNAGQTPIECIGY